jgi:hypothetical protein
MIERRPPPRAPAVTDPQSSFRAPVPAASSVPTRDEREQIIELLSGHFANDRLSLDDFEERAAAVYAAPDRAALQALVADLGGQLGVPGGTSVVAVVDDDASEFERVRVFMSSTGRAGPFVVPHRMEVSATMGDLSLDLRGATFRRGVTVIDVRAVMSSVVITVQADVPVEITGSAIVGAFHVSARERASSNVPAPQLPMLLRVTGRSVLANVEVRVVPLEDPGHGD